MNTLPPIGFRPVYRVVEGTVPGLVQAQEHYRSKNRIGYLAYIPSTWDGMMLTEARFTKNDETPRTQQERDYLEWKQLDAFARMKQELHKISRKPHANPDQPTERRLHRKGKPKNDFKQHQTTVHSQAFPFSGSGGEDHWFELNSLPCKDPQQPAIDEKQKKRMQRLRNLDTHGRAFDIVTGARIEVCRPQFNAELFVEKKFIIHPSLMDFGWKRGWWK